MKLNFKLSQILFLLIMVPLAFELILVGTAMTLATSPEALQRFEGTILTGIVASIALSLWMAMYFSNTLKARIGALKDNMDRLSKGEPLNPKLPGIDEIAELDEALHLISTQVSRR